MSLAVYEAEGLPISKLKSYMRFAINANPGLDEFFSDGHFIFNGSLVQELLLPHAWLSGREERREGADRKDREDREETVLLNYLTRDEQSSESLNSRDYHQVRSLVEGGEESVFSSSRHI